MTKTIDKPITLFTYPNSPWGNKVFWALQYKGAKFDVNFISGFTQKEIAFSEQKVVPVTRFGEEWIQDSRDTCIHLDTLYPENPFAGGNDEEKEAIIAADQWVNVNIMALHFRALVDKKASAISKRNAQRMANVIFPSFGGFPPQWFRKHVMAPNWVYVIRHVGFVMHAASQVDKTKTLEEIVNRIGREFEARIEKTGFLAGTETPSFADIAAFGYMSFSTTNGFELVINANTSPAINLWYERVKSYFPKQDKIEPKLYSKWPPFGF
jgi:glutathione S-transferase